MEICYNNNMASSSLRGLFFDPDDIAKEDTSLFWQQIVFSAFSTLIIIGGSLLTIQGSYQFFKDRNYLMVFLDILFYFTIISFTLCRKLPFTIRKRSVVYCFLLIGSVLLIVTGPHGASLTYVLCSFICGGLFESRKGLINHILFTLTTFLIITILLFTDRLSGFAVVALRDTWAIIIGNMLLIGSVLEIIVFNVTNGLQKQTKELHNQQKYLESIFNSSMDPMFTIDDRYRIIKLNTAASTFLGGSSENYSGIDLFRLINISDKREETLLRDTILSIPSDPMRGKTYNHIQMTDDSGRMIQTIISISPLSQYFEKKMGQEIIGAVISIKDMTAEYMKDIQLKQYEWLTEKTDLFLSEDNSRPLASYGDLTRLNRNRLILDSVGEKTLFAYAKELMLLLDSSINIFESNGDYALSMISSSWCKLHDEASREKNRLIDNSVAIGSGLWDCHECRWTQNARIVIDSGRPLDSLNSCGLSVFGVPIKAGDTVIGAINIGYGTPPEDLGKLKELSKLNHIELEHIQQVSKEYKPRPQYIIDVEKYRLQTIARLIGEIVERKQTARELEKVQSLKRIGYLAGGIAHDFNNILTGVYGYISLAKMTFPEDHEAFLMLETAEKSIDRATNLTSKLLTFAKGGTPIKQILHTSSLIKEIVYFELSGSKIEPIFKIDNGSYHINADKTQIEQVFSNLIHNAVQAMPKGGKLYIHISNIIDNGIVYLQVSIKDEGIGIPAESIEHIFDPFFTLKEHGTGIGLATVYSIITKHGGTISVTSVEGTGSTFILQLPTSSEMIINPVITNPKDSIDLSQFSVLIMDDEKTVRKIAQSLLEKQFRSVSTVPNGTEALKTYTTAQREGDPFDLVILDLTIPGDLGGVETLQELKLVDPEVKAIISSGYVDNSDIAQYSAYGFIGYIGKPYIQSQLLKKLRTILEAEDLSPRR